MSPKQPLKRALGKTSAHRKPPRRAFEELKEEALDLLEWGLNDVSPPGQHALKLKMGIEREGHFHCTHLKEPTDKENVHDWEKRDVRPKYDDLAEALMAEFTQYKDFNVERIYHDHAGTYLMEMTTKPVGAKLAAQSTKKICVQMLESAKMHGFDHGCFGTTPSYTSGRSRVHDFLVRNGQVFTTPEGPVLAGRGQHANVSIWCGDKNLFFYSPYREDHDPDDKTLSEAVVWEAMRTLPGMILPSRHSNYLRINGNSSLSIQSIRAAIYDKDKRTAMLWKKEITPSDIEIRQLAPHQTSHHDETRLEFRQAAADADPLDVALAAAIPATKTFLELAEYGEDGKVTIRKGMPVLNLKNAVQANTVDMPRSEKEAAALFNRKDNPNFVFLDELAQCRIDKLEQLAITDHSTVTAMALERAKRFQDIGSKLHAMYCREYGLESVMKQRPTARMRSHP